MAAWFFVIPVQPVTKTPSAANASCLLIFIACLPANSHKKFCSKYDKVPPSVKQIFELFQSTYFLDGPGSQIRR